LKLKKSILSQKKCKIEGVPTVIFYRNGSEIDRVNGAKVADVARKVEIHCAPSANIPLSKPTESKEDLDDKLKKLINKASVMLFMKGNPDEPKCGFSRQIVQILKDHRISFQTFDILTDEEVRQGLKKYSNWPTYPQVYVNGDLIGGLDIIKEYVENDELESMMPESIDKRLKKLINQHKIMVFMKGTPTEPRCGFSKTTIAIMTETGLPFEYFNILEDDEVRQGLKSYSSWPTYPQIYVDGELMGGVDILKELKETDELLSTLQNSS